MRIELSHDLLGKQIFTRLTAEEKALRKAERMLKDSYDLHNSISTEGKSRFLNREELIYLGSYIKQIRPEEHLAAYIEESEILIQELEQAEKERLKAGIREQRKFKYLLGAVLVVLGIFTFVLYLQFGALSNSEEQLEEKNALLEKNFGLTESQLDSVNKILEQLPPENIRTAGNNLVLKKIKSDIEKRMKTDSIQTEIKLTIEYGKLFVESHLFPTNATYLSPRDIRFLRSIIKIANGFPTYGINVEVHTDDSGDSAQNLRTSFYRASLIGNLLVDSLKYDAQRLHLAGKGESRPLILVETNMASIPRNQARNKNRRVNLILYPL